MRRGAVLLGLLLGGAVGLLAIGPGRAGHVARAASGAKRLPLYAVGAPPADHHADPSLKTYTRRIGPFHIGPYQTYRASHLLRPPGVRGSIVGMDVRVVGAAGQTIPQYKVMLHHIVITNSGPTDNLNDGACPDPASWQRFYGSSEELRAMTFPPGYGYPTTRRDHWRTSFMLMNHRWPPRTFYIQYRATVDPSHDITPVTPYWLSVIPCSSDPQFTVPGGGARGSSYRKDLTFHLPRAGRIVAIGGHMHGGAREVDLTEPNCGDREVFAARPMYAPAGDPLYKVKPLLHEPDPKNVSWWQSATGLGIRPSDTLKVSAVYDDSRPHMRVMGIDHVYVAPGDPGPACGPLPADAQVLGADFAGRPAPPRVRPTIAAFGADGHAHAILRPRGPVERLRSGRVTVRHYGFHPPNLSIPRGGRIRWTFRDPVQHDATLATGPRGFAAPWSRRGATFAHRFTVPGTYRLYCSLHPVEMSEYIHVRR